MFIFKLTVFVVLSNRSFQFYMGTFIQITACFPNGWQGSVASPPHTLPILNAMAADPPSTAPKESFG